VYGRLAYFLGPDGVKIELVTNDQKGALPILAHHIHFINKQCVEMQQWYMKAFNATLRPVQTDFFIGGDLPGVGYSLNFFGRRATSPSLTFPLPAALPITWGLK
jgi:hypothetical protein